MTKLIVGCGYLGERVAQRWRAAGERVAVVTRSAERAQRLAAAGYEPVVADVLHPESLSHLPLAETVLFAVGYDRSAGHSIHEVYVDGLRHVLDAVRLQQDGKFIYVSSTGVYGPSQGDWVDEQSECLPQRPGGVACWAAEQMLAAHPLGARSLVLRMAGLYGPGRIPNAKPLLAGQPIEAPEQGYLNLIHIDDAAAVVLAAERRGVPPRTYVISDGNPIERRTYYSELARLLGAASPTFVTPPLGAPGALRAEANKRVCNARMVAELAVPLAFPTYREGLAAIVAAENSVRPGS